MTGVIQQQIEAASRNSHIGRSCKMNHPSCNGDICQEAADRAVVKVFAILGVDINCPRDVEAFREDLRFGSKLRHASDYGMLAIIGLISVGLAAALWTGIVSKVGGK